MRIPVLLTHYVASVFTCFVFSQGPRCYPNQAAQPQNNSEPSPPAIFFSPPHLIAITTVNTFVCWAARIAVSLCVIHSRWGNNGPFSHRGETCSCIPASQLTPPCLCLWFYILLQQTPLPLQKGSFYNAYLNLGYLLSYITAFPKLGVETRNGSLTSFCLVAICLNRMWIPFPD